MALATRRSYAGAAPACTLSSDIAAGATSFSITGTTTNWPTTATGPFYMVIDPGLSTEEKVLVGARTGGSLSTVTRGVDGTTAASHVTGATCYPVFTAVDANDANLLASRLSAKGDLISSDGSDPTKVAVGSNNTRLVADSAQTSGIKWVADTQNTVVDAKGDLLVGTAADTVARLAVGANGKVLEAASGETTGLKWGGPVAMEFISSTTVGSAVSSVTVSNCFSSTYSNYRVVISGMNASVLATSLFIRFDAGGTTNYYSSVYYDQQTGLDTATLRRSAQSSSGIGTTGTSNDTTVGFDISLPNAVNRTSYHGTFHASGYSGWFGGTSVATTQYTDFTIFPNSGTLTGGTIKVYGYRDA